MKKNILQALICFFLIGCTSERPDKIIVYYMHGFVDTSVSIPCSKMRTTALQVQHSEASKYDSIVINHKAFVRLKNYLQNIRHVPQGTKTEIHDIDSRIIVVYDTLAVSFQETWIKYGADSNNNLVYGDEKVIYLIKSLSGYYNYFTKHDLLEWFPEIRKYGIPSTYKHIVYARFIDEERRNITIPDSITQTTSSKIIFVDGWE